MDKRLTSPTSTKLDRFLLSLEWEELFLSASARALLCILSDHVAVLLDVGESVVRSSIFRFENVVSHAQFESEVRQLWSSLNESDNDLGGFLVLKLVSLRSFLKIWSRNNFTHVVSCKRQLLSSIQFFQVISDTRPLTAMEKTI